MSRPAAWCTDRFNSATTMTPTDSGIVAAAASLAAAVAAAAALWRQENQEANAVVVCMR